MNDRIKGLILKIKPFKYYAKGRNILNDPIYKETQSRNHCENLKRPSRTGIINFLLSLMKSETYYLEIGVRNPEHNFNHIKANYKYSVDPGLEFEPNPVDFKMTSDEFF